MFTKSHLIQQLKSMGIQRNDTVLIHTSLKAIGKTENGANGIIDLFTEYLSEGLFLVPTHTWANVNENNPVYDARTTVPCIGTLPTVACNRIDGYRSLHPTHSVWAKGKYAEEFIAGEENAHTPCSVGFLWDKLADIGAKILLIGVKNNRNTFIHSVDERADLQDRLADNPFNVTIIDADGKKTESFIYPHSCSWTNDVSMNFVRFEDAFIRTGVESFGVFGNAETRIIDAEKCRSVVERIYSGIKGDPFLEYEDFPLDLYM